MVKVRTMITIDKDLLEDAKSQGYALSTILNKLLKEHLESNKNHASIKNVEE